MSLLIHIYFFLSVWGKGHSWTYWCYMSPVAVNMGPSGGKVTEESDSVSGKPGDLWVEKLDQNFSAALLLSLFLKLSEKKKKRKINFLGLFSPLTTYFLPWMFLCKYVMWSRQCLLCCVPVWKSTHMGLHSLLIHIFAFVELLCNSAQNLLQFSGFYQQKESLMKNKWGIWLLKNLAS